MSKFRKWNLREPKFAKFPGGACPQSPPEARAFGANNYSLFSITWGWNLWKDYSFLGNDTFPNLYDALVYERKFQSEYLERQIYERSLKSEPSIVKLIEKLSEPSIVK